MKTRENVLSALEVNKGVFISGEELAKQIGVSRNSVWKAVKDLKEDGYIIEAVTNKGYRLSQSSDIISPQGIAAYLYDKKDVSYLEVYDKLASTSLLAKEKALTEDFDKHVIIARTQTAGKGHGKRFFDSPEGGIYISFIIMPEHVKWDYLPLFVAVVAAEVLSEYYSDLSIKWVNDIYASGKKICGILTESVSDMETGEVSSYIIGIGINCKINNKNKLIANIINRIFYPDIYYQNKNLPDYYREKLMYINERVKLVVYGEKPEEFYARLIDMDETGRLVVKKDDGTTEHIRSGQIVE